MVMLSLEKLKKFNKSDLDEIIKTKDKDKIQDFLTEWGLEQVDNKIMPNAENKLIWKNLYSHYDKRQLVTKISLNSALNIRGH